MISVYLLLDWLLNQTSPAVITAKLSFQFSPSLTQSFATAHAKLCICSRKALHDIVSPILNEKREERLSISGTVVPQGNYCRLVLPDYNYLRQRRLISSRVLPLVSGTMRQTKRAARMQMVP